MKALLIVAHGSRREKSNEEVRNLTNSIKNSDIKEYQSVSCAFLELTTPLMQDKMVEMVKKGVKEVTVFPYFISEGHHVTKDLPEIIEQVKKDHPNLLVNTVPHLGKFPGLVNLIVKHLNAK